MNNKQLTSISSKLKLTKEIVTEAYKILMEALSTHLNFQMSCEVIAEFCKEESHQNLLIDILVTVEGYDPKVAQDMISKYILFGIGHISKEMLMLKAAIRDRIIGNWAKTKIVHWFNNPIVNACVYDYAKRDYVEVEMDFRYMDTYVFDLAFTRTGINRDFSVQHNMAIGDNKGNGPKKKIVNGKVHFTRGYHSKQEVGKALKALALDTTDPDKVSEVHRIVIKLEREIRTHLKSL